MRGLIWSYIIPTHPSPPIAVLGTLDTKGLEAKYLADCVQSLGYRAVLIDIGLLGEPSVKADVSRADVLQAGEASGAAIDGAGDREHAMSAVAEGTASILMSLLSRGELAGVVALGGSKGTWIATSAMRRLPWGVPKVMVASTVTGDLRRYAGHRDLVFQSTVVDLAGLNEMTRLILARAAAMVTALAATTVEKMPRGTPIALTMAGVVTPCGQRVDRMLRERGFEPIVLPANGAGGLALEEIVESGSVAGVVELALLELSNEVVGGVCAAGANRLETAARRGLPQVIVPGAVDFANFAGRSTIPERYRHRQLLDHTPAITLMRLSTTESRASGKLVGTRLGHARGPTEVLIPMRGFSSYDQLGAPFQDEAADRAFVDGLRSKLDSGIHVVERDEHINDPEFAVAVVSAFERVTAAADVGPEIASEARIAGGNQWA